MYGWRKLFLMVVIAPTLLFGGGQQGGNYPNGPITFVVPFKAGGATDAVARTVQKALKDSGAVTVPVVVKNVAGGGGLIGMREGLKARPDGQTFLLTPHAIYITPPYSKAGFSFRDFEAVAQFGATPFVYLVREDSPYQTLAELVQAKNLNLRNLTGGTVDVINAMLEEITGNNTFNLVNTGGGSGSLQLLLSGGLDAGAFTLIEYSQYRHQGTRGIALLDSSPRPEFPELVPAKEQGIDLTFSQIYYVLGPPKTPDGAVTFMSSALEKALALPGVKEAFSRQGMDPTFHGKDEVGELMAKEGARIEKVVNNELLTRK